MRRLGAEMRVCERAGGGERCVRAVLDSGGAGDMVFVANSTRLLFGYADAPAPFFWGTRRSC